MTGWEPIEVPWIIATLQALPRPWPDEAVLMWLRYASKAVALERAVETPTAEGPWKQRRVMLGQRELATATGRKWWDIRKIYESKEWADPLSRAAHAPLTESSRGHHAVRTDADRESAPSADRSSRAAHAPLTESSRGHHAVRTRARVHFSTETPSPTPSTGEAAPNVEPSPPPAEPSGTSEQFQPSSDDYVFDDADQRDIIEQPSDPRQIESPAQPFDPIEGSTLSPSPKLGGERTCPPTISRCP